MYVGKKLLRRTNDKETIYVCMKVTGYHGGPKIDRLCVPCLVSIYLPTYLPQS